MNRIFFKSRISPSDVSFIVQGAIMEGTNGTKSVLRAIRKVFPGSEIILSTWEGSDVKDLDFDTVIMSKDPGSYSRVLNRQIPHNGNRQIISTINGLRKSTRVYSVKMRTDMLFYSNNFLRWFGRYNKWDKDFKYLKERIIVCNLSSVNPHKIEQIPFCVSDWFYFGFKEDLIDIFDIPLFPEPEYTHWFTTHPQPANWPYSDWVARYNNEPYIWFTFLKKHRQITFEHQCDVSNNNIELSEKILANNTVILSPQDIGFKSTKYSFSEWPFERMYNFKDWKNLYKKYAKV